MDITISKAIEKYLITVSTARSENTLRTYKNCLNIFLSSLRNRKIDITTNLTSRLTTEDFSYFINDLKYYAPSTEQLYLSAVFGFFEFMVAENMIEINLQTLRLLIRKRSRKPGVRLPQFPKSNIDRILEGITEIKSEPVENEVDHLINLRDCAFLITLADTGLRIHEACNLRRGDMDWYEHRAIVIGKGNREAVVRFSERSIQNIRDYLKARAEIDGASGQLLTSLPIFARHDKASGNRIKPISTTTGRKIVARRVGQFLGEDEVGTITPHSFRHYFVTRVLQGSGNLKLAQSLARHKNIAITQRYAHLNDDELDKGYRDIFEDE